jgi:hypothetical protein
MPFCCILLPGEGGDLDVTVLNFIGFDELGFSMPLFLPVVVLSNCNSWAFVETIV